MTNNEWIKDFDIRTIYRTAKKNAPRRGIPFEVTFEEMASLFARSTGKCDKSAESDAGRNTSKEARRKDKVYGLVLEKRSTKERRNFRLYRRRTRSQKARTFAKWYDQVTVKK